MKSKPQPKIFGLNKDQFYTMRDTCFASRIYYDICQYRKLTPSSQSTGLSKFENMHVSPFLVG